MTGFDIIVFLIVGVAAIGGFMRGFVQEVLSLASWVLAVFAIYALHTDVTAFLFVLPLLRRLGGARDPLPSAIAQRLGVPLPAVGDRREFVRARSGEAGLHPLSEQDSSALAALAQAEWLIERPAGSAPAPAGSEVRAYWLENGGMA